MAILFVLNVLLFWQPAIVIDQPQAENLLTMLYLANNDANDECMYHSEINNNWL